jgi:hypothetical protein
MAIGVVLASAGSRVNAALLFGVKVFDVVTLASVVVVARAVGVGNNVVDVAHRAD